MFYVVIKTFCLNKHNSKHSQLKYWLILKCKTINIQNLDENFKVFKHCQHADCPLIGESSGTCSMSSRSAQAHNLEHQCYLYSTPCQMEQFFSLRPEGRENKLPLPFNISLILRRRRLSIFPLQLKPFRASHPSKLCLLGGWTSGFRPRCSPVRKPVWIQLHSGT